MSNYEINPIILCEKISHSIKNYILTTMSINSRFDKLKKDFVSLVEKKKFIEGPYVEGLPDFEKGRSLNELLLRNSGFLHNDFSNLPSIILDRKLHKHQDEALNLACKGKNIIVATGTGSGKTEAFLYPIIDKLLKEESNLYNPGVRVIIIYPLNALANDQLYFRIAPLICTQLQNKNLTFGRYTSDTKPNSSRKEMETEILKNKKIREIFGEKLPLNWLLTREEMLDRPPHILITNYAMLEHILLLPKNSALFQNNRLNTIILDEIHTYSGAQASEVALLIRKLKNKLGIKEGIQVFGTSASLAKGLEANHNLISFAKDLFGEDIHKVIRGRRVPNSKLVSNSKKFSIPLDSWIAIRDFLSTYLSESPVPDEDELIEAWNTILTEDGIPKLRNNSFKKALFEKFQNSREFAHIANILAERESISFKELASLIFNSTEKNDHLISYNALSTILYLGSIARESETSYSLLPCRYHVISNSINGLSVTIDNSNNGSYELKDSRIHFDEINKKYYFQLYTCRRCGQLFIEAFYDEENNIISNKSFSETGSYLERVVFMLNAQNTNIIREDEEGNSLENIGDDFKWFINTKTWQRVREDGPNVVTLIKVNTRKYDDERVSYVSACPNCGGKTTGAINEIITPFYPSNEALNSLITHIVIESLPKNKTNYNALLNGRKILAFSDNRQDAAYFAPFFQRTSNDIAIRSILKNTIYNKNGIIYFADLIYEVETYLKDNDAYVLFDIDGKIVTNTRKKTEILAGLITAELCTPIIKKISLEYLGILLVYYSNVKEIAEILKPLVGEEFHNDLIGIINFCLSTIRLQKAVSPIVNGLSLTEEEIFGVHCYKSSFQLYKESRTNYVKGFLPKENTSYQNIRTGLATIKWTKS